MAVETKPKTFTKGGNPLKTWGKGLADVLGVKVVNEQSQAPKQEFATANTVNPNAPTLGEIQTTQADFGLKTLSESPVSSVPPAPEGNITMTPRDSLGVPAAIPESNLNSVPPVPAAVSEISINQVPPVPTIADSTIINNPVSEPTSTIGPNPAEIPPAPPTIPEVPEPEIVTSQTPVPEPEVKTDTPSMPEPKIVDMKEDEPPTVVPPSMGAPAIVSDVPPVETTKPEVTPAPDVFQSAFQEESQDHLDPTVNSSSQPEPEAKQNNEFDVRINIDPIADELVQKNSDMFLKVGPDGKLILDKSELEAQIFAKKVLDDPSIGNLLKQMEDFGISTKTAKAAIMSKLETLNT
ncbi:MAG: hypothetical protein KA035_02060 [Candidatus Levybacteria bacterium]|nr:hypothetical protein [Candidatus Levybacteria bacterium]